MTERPSLSSGTKTYPACVWPDPGGTITARFLPCISRFIRHRTPTAHTRPNPTRALRGVLEPYRARDSALLSAQSPVVSSSPSAMLRFCTAAPLAPLPRLSRRAVSTQVRACARAGARASVHQCASTSVRQYISACVHRCIGASGQPHRGERGKGGGSGGGGGWRVTSSLQ